MAKLIRVAELDGTAFTVPQYVNRTVSGWQVRVRGIESKHFADAHYGGAVQAMAAATHAVSEMVRIRDYKVANLKERK